eukprot:TRINITY_DN13887_c0_g1_i1.p1 TRINITY_DN13887_c0_g1~~TRINITY_DN13887_c0_g1_i1.p1  ORF type:complete len:197 (+),score=77.89 TRINITY_DN13887_c0_g1_i1:81-671(+)
MSEDSSSVVEKECNKCGKKGLGLSKCSRCKLVFYCNRDCQSKDWATHKANCIKPEDRPKPVSEEVVVGYVECETFQQCRDYLQSHPELISKEVADEMFERGFVVLKTHPLQFGTRFIRNAQILTYLLDLRKISGGQQDITLFFARILDPNNPEYRNNFTIEYTAMVTRIVNRHKQLKEEKEAKEAKLKEEEQAKSN